jgi:hypothetical protein
MDPKERVVAFQWNDEEVDDELLLIEEDVDRPTDARARHMVAVRHCDLQAEAEATGGGGMLQRQR